MTPVQVGTLSYWLDSSNRSWVQEHIWSVASLLIADLQFTDGSLLYRSMHGHQQVWTWLHSYISNCVLVRSVKSIASTRILLDQELCMSNDDTFSHLRFRQTDTHLDLLQRKNIHALFLREKKHLSTCFLHSYTILFFCKYTFILFICYRLLTTELYNNLVCYCRVDQENWRRSWSINDSNYTWPVANCFICCRVHSDALGKDSWRGNLYA
jgi:hypothetical protein